MPYCRLGLRLGLGLGHACVTHGPPKGHPRATQGSIGGSAFVFNKSEKKGVGARIAGIARDRKSKTVNHKGREGTQRKSFETYANRAEIAEVYANLG